MKQKINNSQDAARLIFGTMKDLMDEQLMVITLDKGMHVKAIYPEVTKGNDSSCIISAKQIARLAVIDYAGGVILVHNHPSGNSKPSEHDINATEDIKKALNLLDIPLVDHLIIGDGEYYSMNDGCKSSYYD